MLYLYSPTSKRSNVVVFSSFNNYSEYTKYPYIHSVIYWIKFSNKIQEIHSILACIKVTNRMIGWYVKDL